MRHATSYRRTNPLQITDVQCILTPCATTTSMTYVPHRTRRATSGSIWSTSVVSNDGLNLLRVRLMLNDAIAAVGSSRLMLSLVLIARPLFTDHRSSGRYFCWDLLWYVVIWVFLKLGYVSARDSRM